MISANVSSDRIGTPEGPMGYSLTFAKGIPSLKVAPYVSVRYSEFERGFNYPFGVNIQLDKQWSLLPMNDGRRSHLMLNYSQADWSVSLMAVWFKHPGISVSFGF
jgi:hypothetical protein